MSHFPASVYDIVFASRQVLSAASGPHEVKAAQGSGFLHRFAKLFGRGAEPASLPTKELDELWEYHNPTLGVREFHAGR